jgi:hypothetical protein
LRPEVDCKNVVAGFSPRSKHYPFMAQLRELVVEGRDWKIRRQE